MNKFWELVIFKHTEDMSWEPDEWLRQAFMTEKFAKDRAEEDNQKLRDNLAPIQWKSDHHGGYESVNHPTMNYFVGPRTVFPIDSGGQMSTLSKRFPGLKPGEYMEIGTPEHITRQLPGCVSVRTFATPSQTVPDEGYLLQAVKTTKAGWGNGSAAIVCGCMDCTLKAGLVLTGIKTPCKHAKGLRVLLRGRGRAWMKIDD